MKALGTGWNHGVRWRDCEVVRMPGGRPTITFHGKAGEFAAKLGVKNAALSISHTAGTGDRASHSRELKRSARRRAPIRRPPSARLSPSNSLCPLSLRLPTPTASSTEIPEKTLLAGLALTSFSALLLELALTRLFSVVLFYHFAFLAISIALLGLGAGGVFAYLLKTRLAATEHTHARRTPLHGELRSRARRARDRAARSGRARASPGEISRG